uniref:VPLPA-CTERM sorting domain-containing protein n=1 Tax=Primorskyibacter sedentarius TaxID=745311 RepID=UPI003EB871C6
ISGAENTLFNLMLWTISSTKDQGYQIDYVTVTGDEIPPVPLPAGLPLLAGGLAAFGLVRRKRKQA